MTYDALTGTVDFSDALVSLKQGVKMRRKGWLPGSYIELAEDAFKAGHIAGTVARVGTPCMEDLLAADWEELL